MKSGMLKNLTDIVERIIHIDTHDFPGHNFINGGHRQCSEENSNTACVSAHHQCDSFFLNQVSAPIPILLLLKSRHQPQAANTVGNPNIIQR